MNSLEIIRSNKALSTKEVKELLNKKSIAMLMCSPDCYIDALQCCIDGHGKPLFDRIAGNEMFHNKFVRMNKGSVVHRTDKGINVKLEFDKRYRTINVFGYTLLFFSTIDAGVEHTAIYMVL